MGFEVTQNDCIGGLLPEVQIKEARKHLLEELLVNEMLDHFLIVALF